MKATGMTWQAIARIMKPKCLSWLMVTVLFTAVSLARAQKTGQVPQIGYLSSSSSSSVSLFTEAFRQGLRDLGYFEGKNILVEYRFADGKFDELPKLAGELVRLKVDVIVVAGGATLVRATMKATDTIPIVMTSSADPVGSGLVASLAQPGGNVTGLGTLSLELGDKRLELLKEVVPKLSRVGVLGGPDSPGNTRQMKEIEIAARALGVRLQPVNVRGVDELSNAFSKMSRDRVGAIMTLIHPMFTPIPGQIAELAVRNRLPSIFPQPEAVEAGGLMAYGRDSVALYRRAAVFVDKILKGRKPADLPVEQPMKFDLVINLKTAKQLGLIIPQWTLMKADRVIR